MPVAPTTAAVLSRAATRRSRTDLGRAGTVTAPRRRGRRAGAGEQHGVGLGHQAGAEVDDELGPRIAGAGTPQLVDEPRAARRLLGGARGRAGVRGAPDEGLEPLGTPRAGNTAVITLVPRPKGRRAASRAVPRHSGQRASRRAGLRAPPRDAGAIRTSRSPRAAAWRGCARRGAGAASPRRRTAPEARRRSRRCSSPAGSA